MAVFRVAKNRDFTIMSNHHLKNDRLSFKAKGVLAAMLSLPDDWDYTINGLARMSKDGVSSISSALKELEQQGYLERRRIRDANGRMKDIEYIIYEHPAAASSDAAPTGECRETQIMPASAPKRENRILDESALAEHADMCMFGDEPEGAFGEPNRIAQTQYYEERKLPCLAVNNAYERNADVNDCDGEWISLNDSRLADSGYAANTAYLQPKRENPFLEDLHTENRVQLSTKEQRTKELKTNDSSPQIYPSFPPSADRKDRRKDYFEAESIIRDQIEYYTLCTPDNCDLLDALVKVMLDVAMNESEHIRLGSGTVYRTDYVRSTFEQLTSSHIQHVMESLRANTTRIINMRAYLLTALFNAVSTRDCHYAMLANHHMNRSEVVFPFGLPVQLE